MSRLQRSSKQNANFLVCTFTQNRAKKSTIFHVFPTVPNRRVCSSISEFGIMLQSFWNSLNACYSWWWNAYIQILPNDQSFTGFLLRWKWNGQQKIHKSILIVLVVVLSVSTLSGNSREGHDVPTLPFQRPVLTSIAFAIVLILLATCSITVL